LERSHAEVAGLGFAGKNTLLIHPRRGSYLFLGEIITNTALDTSPVSPMPGCGACTRCLSACPTGAFPSPYVLDARRCISYLTIEHRGFIPAELRPALGRWVFGCDICQEVCPWQRFRRTSAWADRFLPPDLERSAPSLASLLALTDEQFAHRFRGTAVYRIRRPRLVRNACVAAGNSGLEALAASLIPLLQDDQPIVRGHAAWALGRLGSGRAALASALSRETDPQARDEIAAALAGVSPA
jgi:epoxyqueuosine reductase